MSVFPAKLLDTARVDVKMQSQIVHRGPGFNAHNHNDIPIASYLLSDISGPGLMEILYPVILCCYFWMAQIKAPTLARSVTCPAHLKCAILGDDYLTRAALLILLYKSIIFSIPQI